METITICAGVSEIQPPKQERNLLLIQSMGYLLQVQTEMLSAQVQAVCGSSRPSSVIYVGSQMKTWKQTKKVLIAGLACLKS